MAERKERRQRFNYTISTNKISIFFGVILKPERNNYFKRKKKNNKL